MQTDEKRTATAVQRIVAYLIDYGVMVCFIGINAAASFVLPSAWFNSPASSHLVGFLGLTVPVWLYFSLTEASPWQGSVGKKVRGLSVGHHRTGDRLTWKQSFLRSGIKFLPWELAHTFIWRLGVWPDWVTSTGMTIALLLMLLSIAPAFFTTTRQTVWDWVAQTAVYQQAAGDKRPLKQQQLTQKG